MASLAGKLLVATPNLSDPNFSQSVVLMLQHGEQGAIGLVLNRPSGTHLSAIWSQISDAPCSLDMPVMTGGPVEGPLVILHADDELSERQVMQGVYFAAHKDLITQLLAKGVLPMRIFAGYAGWGEGQLESEIEEGSWSMTEATREFIFGDFDDIWHQANKTIADDILIRGLGIKHVPPQPWLN
jgi:putative transcriptional regulator